MFNPDNDPSTHPSLNGKLHRYATGTTCVRTLRTDQESEAALVTLRQVLAKAHDKPSTSLLVRRALKIYRSHVAAMNQEAIERERVEVRQHSHVPRRRRRPKKT